MTDNKLSILDGKIILIHTSVKLVTDIASHREGLLLILIHTSVKLVTRSR